MKEQELFNVSARKKKSVCFKEMAEREWNTCVFNVLFIFCCSTSTSVIRKRVERMQN